jgi:hypothetical protein
VPYVIVQAHTPILGPVSSIGSSRLRYEGGARSDLWRIMKRYGVDAYLCGEVHDTTATTRDGILQLAHGGIFQFGLTTFAQLDFDSERLRISLLDFDVRTRDVADGTRLWETASSGMPKILRVRPEPTVIGTIALDGQGNVTERSGNLNPLEGGATRRSVGAVTGVPASP